MARYRFAGRVAVITGAAAGIGRALAIHLGRLGCRLALSDIDEPQLARTAEGLRGQGVEVDARRLDVADRVAFHDYAQVVAARLGGVDIVINNAGVGLIKPLRECDYADFERVININLWGVIHGTQEFLPYLGRSDDAHLVNLSSIFGLIAVPTQGVYNLTKFAVRGYTEALRQELAGTSIHVACVHPGFVRTGIAESSVGTERERFQAELDWFERQALTSAKTAAATIVRGISRRNPRILVGIDAHLVDVMQRLLPQSYTHLVRMTGPRP